MSNPLKVQNVETARALIEAVSLFLRYTLSLTAWKRSARDLRSLRTGFLAAPAS
jgi:hypothetical protein